MKYPSDSLDILSVIDKKELRNCFEFLQKVFFLLDVLVFVCALGDFPASFASVLRQIAAIFLITEAKLTRKLIPNHRTINSKQFLNDPFLGYFLDVTLV